MNIPVAPLNRLVVTLEKKLYDTVTFDSGVKLHIDPTWHPEEFAMLKAKVVSVPRGISTRYDYKEYTCNIQPGDEILVRYDLVFSYAAQPDRANPVYRNMFLHFNEQIEKFDEYWMCDIQKVFAVKNYDKGQDFEMQNGYIYLEPIKNKLNDPFAAFWPNLTHTTTATSGIILPPFSNYESPKYKARVLHSTKYQPGETVYFDMNVVQKYKYDTTEFWIIKERHVLATARE